MLCLGKAIVPHILIKIGAKYQPLTTWLTGTSSDGIPPNTAVFVPPTGATKGSNGSNLVGVRAG